MAAAIVENLRCQCCLHTVHRVVCLWAVVCPFLLVWRQIVSFVYFFLHISPKIVVFKYHFKFQVCVLNLCCKKMASEILMGNNLIKIKNIYKYFNENLLGHITAIRTCKIFSEMCSSLEALTELSKFGLHIFRFFLFFKTTFTYTP